MALRKFKSFIRDGRKPTSTQAQRSDLKEEASFADIQDAGTVIIGAELSTAERQDLADTFINSVSKMISDGATVIATAVAF